VGFSREARVNVLWLNLALDAADAKKSGKKALAIRIESLLDTVGGYSRPGSWDSGALSAMTGVICKDSGSSTS